MKKQSLNLNFEIDKEKYLYAHSLFNKGILSGEFSCYGSFQIIDDKWLNQRSQMINKIMKKKKI